MLSVFDKKARLWLPPFTSVNLAVGERTFRNAVVEPGAPFHMNARDFELYHIGEFHQETAVVVSLERPVHIIDAVDCFAVVSDGREEIAVQDGRERQLDFTRPMGVQAGE